MVKKFINVCFLIISIHVFRQIVIIFTPSDGIITNIILSRNQMFNILLTVFNTTHLVKNKQGSIKHIYVKSTDSIETITEAEKRIINNLYHRDR
jgi:hypothetical protein